VLRYRIISALVLVPLVVVAVLRLDVGNFALLAALVVVLGSWEWAALVPLRQLTTRVGYVMLTLALLALTWKFAQHEVLVNLVLWLAMLWWLFALFWISRPALGSGENSAHASVKSALGIGLLLSTWLALVVLHSRPDQGPHWVLFVLVLVWVADSGAYFAGKQWGRTRLAPQVSPGKTWEGVLGALIVCSLFAFGYAWFIGLQGPVLASFVLVCLVTVLFSVAGDLLESLMKRQRGVKDSGNLIPGHGGLLDRIDSLLAATPVFLFGLRWIDL
jgi:phosphatidate cytidylyltransferase